MKLFILLSLVAFMANALSIDPEYMDTKLALRDQDMDDHDPLAHNIAEILPEPTARTQSAEEIAAECGVLGVKEVPAGADASQYRKCRDHPLTGTDIGPNTPIVQGALAPGIGAAADVTSPASPLMDRGKIESRADCYFGADYGCSNKGWCWTRCNTSNGLGHWCWTAWNGGAGAWAKCSISQQCDPSKMLGLKCGSGCSC